MCVCARARDCASVCVRVTARVCVCVCVCVRARACVRVSVCAPFFVTNEDINLYNDMGMTRRR